MNVALWIVQGLLALVYLAAGGLKVARPREQLVASGNFDWMKDSSDAGVKAVGTVEILGALRVHLVRKERKPLPANVLLLVLAAFVAIGRVLG